jgi:hypothetical protein
MPSPDLFPPSLIHSPLLCHTIFKVFVASIRSQGHSIFANKKKEVTEATLMEYGLGGSGGFNPFNPSHPLNPQSIQTSEAQGFPFFREY